MRKGLGLFVSAVAALSLSALPATAVAEQTITGTGTFAGVSDTVIASWTADGNLFSVHEMVISLDGVLVGTELQETTLIIHPSGPAEFFGTATFTGSVSGIGTGTLEQVINATATTQAGGSGRVTILSGTGDLAGLQGVLMFHSPPPTYSVMFVKP